MKKSTLFLIIATFTVMCVFSVPTFGEILEEKEIPYPVIEKNGDIYIQDGVGYYLIGAIGGVFDDFMRACAIYERYKIKKIVMVLNSPGGGVFDGVGLIQLMEEQKSKGIIVETRCYGLAASAAAIVMAAGSEGHRYIAKGSFVMIHELYTFKFFSVESVSDTEKEAKIKRKIQNELTNMLVKYTNLSREELLDKCKEESWADAETAIKWGFADHIIEGR